MRNLCLLALVALLACQSPKAVAPSAPSPAGTPTAAPSVAPLAASPSAAALPAASGAGASGSPPMNTRVDFETATVLAVGVSSAGHLIMVGTESLVVWDPNGIEKTREMPVPIEKLFGVGATVKKRTSAREMTVVDKAGKEREWTVDAVVAQDGTTATLFGHDVTYGTESNLARYKHVALILDTQSGTVQHALTKILPVGGGYPPYYMFTADRSDLYLRFHRPSQVEIFEIASGKNVYHGPGGAILGFGALVRSSLNQEALMVVDGDKLNLLRLPGGNVLRSTSQVGSFVVSEDRRTVAILGKDHLSVSLWDTTTGKVAKITSLPKACEGCVVQWRDGFRIRLVDTSAGNTSWEVDVQTRVATEVVERGRLVFSQAEGFSVSDIDGPKTGASDTTEITTPSGKVIKTKRRINRYSLVGGRLLVHGEVVWLVDGSGTIVHFKD
jgi:hypothetical protein